MREPGDRRRDGFNEHSDIHSALPYFRDAHRHLHHKVDELDLARMTDYMGPVELSPKEASGNLLLKITRGSANAND
jgi:hypothetical protein